MNTLQTVLIHGRAREEEAISTMPTWTEQTTVSVASAETEKQVRFMSGARRASPVVYFDVY